MAGTNWFFFSYARINKSRNLQTFYEDLWNGLRDQLTAAEQGHKSFADWEGLELGSRWGRSLQEALEWSRVLVCVTSPAYFTQEWCGKELAFFETLTDHHYPGAERIIPVIWGQEQLPATLAQYQFDEREMPAAYRQLGLARIMARQGRGLVYRKCVDVIVEAIIRMGRAIQLRGAIPGKRLADAQSAFQIPNRIRTRVTYCDLGGTDWRPFLPPPDRDEFAHELVETVVARRQIGMEVLPMTPAYRQQVEAAGDDPVLIVLDPRTAGVEGRLDPIRQLERAVHKNTALFVTWNEQDPSLIQDRTELERKISELVPRIGLPQPPAHSALELQQGINATLERFEQLAINRGANSREPTGNLPRVNGI